MGDAMQRRKAHHIGRPLLPPRAATMRRGGEMHATTSEDSAEQLKMHAVWGGLATRVGALNPLQICEL